MRRAIPLGLALVAAAASASATTALAAGCPALDYQAGLAGAAAALQRTPPDAAGAQRTVVGLAAADSGSAVALEPVIADLAGAPADLDDALLRLESMSAALAYPRGSVCNENADAARTALHDVYASPDFRHLDEPPAGNPLAAVVSAIANLLRRGAGALGPLGAVLLAATVLGVGLTLAWRRWHGSAALRGASLVEPATAGDDPDVEWRAAERAAASGEFREAIRRAFRSALLVVAVRGNLHIDAAWTTRELLGRLDAGGDVLLALAGCAAIFERAWYSRGPVTEADWESAADRCRALRRVASGVRTAGP